MKKRAAVAAMACLLVDGASLSATTIPAASRELSDALSPYQWVSQAGCIGSAVNGASVTVQFRRTARVALQVDCEHLKALPASRYPVIAWTVNGGAPQIHQLAAKETTIVLATGTADPLLDLYIKGMSPFEDRYSGDVPPNSVKIVGFTVDDGGAAQPAVPPGKIWLNIGDSIMSGDAAGYAEGQGRPPDALWAASDDARASYGYLLARHYGCRETRIAYGGYDWGGGLGKLPALSILIDQKTSTVSRLSGGALVPNPDFVLVNLGENGVPTEAQVIQALTKIRSRIRPSTKIMVMIPVSGRGRTEIRAAFGKYQRTPNAGDATLIDLGAVKFAAADGQHPAAAGHETIFKAALPLIDPVVNGSAR